MKKLTNKEKRKIKKAGYNTYKNGGLNMDCPYDLDGTEEEQEKAVVWLDGFDEGVEEDYYFRDYDEDF